MTEVKDKMIRTAPEDWKVYNKVAKHMTKQVGIKIPINGAVKLMAQEYLRQHPEIKV